MNSELTQTKIHTRSLRLVQGPLKSLNKMTGCSSCNDLIRILSDSSTNCSHWGSGQRVHDSSVLFLTAAY